MLSANGYRVLEAANGKVRQVLEPDQPASFTRRAAGWGNSITPDQKPKATFVDSDPDSLDTIH